MKKFISVIFIYLSLLQTYANDTASWFGLDKVNSSIIGSDEDLPIIADNLLGYFIGLFYFIAVAIGIYGGFLILTSGGEEEKTKKGKNSILYMVYGLVIIFLTSQIVNWVINVLSDKNIVGN